MHRAESLDRRRLIASALGAAAVTFGPLNSNASQALAAEEASNDPNAQPLKGRIRQSVMGWCFKPMSAAELAKAGRRLGLVAIEGIDAADFPVAKAAGLEISLVGSHGFVKGPVDPQHHAEVEAKLRESIDLAVKFKSPSVITFTGMRVPDMRDEAAKRNCLDCWKRVIGYAEEKQITLCLEHLNSRDNSHPMKGHPGYFGDDVELCIELIKAMDSPRFKLLFDVYHVQIMNGDVIRRIREHHRYIGHYHTAGNPGRGELDDKQEINYPPIMRAIIETGYSGFVAQEFIPTWPDKIAALDHAIGVCDV